MDKAQLIKEITIICDNDIARQRTLESYKKEHTEERVDERTRKIVLKKIEYPNADLLIEIFRGAINELQEDFVKELLNKIENSKETFHAIPASPFKYKTIFCSDSIISMYTVLKLEKSAEVIQALKKRNKRGLTSCGLLLILKDFLDIEHTNLNMDQLQEINQVIKQMQLISNDDNIRHAIEYLTYQISEWSVNKIRFRVNKVNIEINKDKKEIIELTKIIGLKEEYDKLFSSMDRFIESEDKVVAAGMISNIRECLSKVCEEISEKIKSHRGDKNIPDYPKVTTKTGRIREYIKEYLELSDRDDEFIDAFVNLLNKEGGHTFVSEKEYFRLTRNILIEIVLMLLTKYQKKYPT